MEGMSDQRCRPAPRRLAPHREAPGTTKRHTEPLHAERMPRPRGETRYAVEEYRKRVPTNIPEQGPAGSVHACHNNAKTMAHWGEPGERHHLDPRPAPRRDTCHRPTLQPEGRMTTVMTHNTTQRPGHKPEHRRSTAARRALHTHHRCHTREQRPRAGARARRHKPPPRICPTTCADSGGGEEGMGRRLGFPPEPLLQSDTGNLVGRVQLKP